MKKQENNNEPKLSAWQQNENKKSVILNKDVEFENRDVDPGFTPVPVPDDSESAKQEGKENDEVGSHHGAEQGTDRNAPGLGELDGTNPGSNHHPMDEEGV